ncbi:Hint domain-containing protein [Paracoccus sulfuroxidans]|nr:Hint domain-containing protein [Paracoccus sulfuroxidans]
MWIGKAPLFDSTPSTNIGQTQANAINGWTAEGSSGIRPVSVSGNYYTGSVGNHFNTSYQGTFFESPSRFSYDDPDTSAHVSNATINTFVQANFTITVHDADGNSHDVTQSGILMQTSSGDIFFRPSVSSLPEWNDIDRISKVVVSGVSPLPNSTYPATIGFSSSVYELTVVCFARGTELSTSTGSCAVECLQIGTMVKTKDNGMQPIRWMGSKRLTYKQLQANAHLRPIRIRAGALGTNLPRYDLLVSPQHRILVCSSIAQRMFGTNEVLVAAKQLLQLDGIDIASDIAEVEYFHILFDRHEIVFSNGAETESFFTGPEAIKAVGAAASEEIFAIFPELRTRDYRPVAARQLTSGRQARKLAVRHVQNRRSLVS